MSKKLRITVEGKAYDVTVEVLDGAAAPAPVAAAPAPVAAPAPAAVAAAPAPATKPAPKAVAGGKSITCPLAGKVDSIDVKVGDVVKENQTVVTLEAMKMKTYVPSDCAGTVASIEVKVGDAAEEGQVLVTLA